jgi:hypothetical protein
MAGIDSRGREEIYNYTLICTCVSEVSGTFFENYICNALK